MISLNFNQLGLRPRQLSIKRYHARCRAIMVNYLRSLDCFYYYKLFLELKRFLFFTVYEYHNIYYTRPVYNDLGPQDTDRNVQNTYFMGDNAPIVTLHILVAMSCFQPSVIMN